MIVTQYKAKVNMPGCPKGRIANHTLNGTTWADDNSPCQYSVHQEPKFFGVVVPPPPPRFPLGSSVCVKKSVHCRTVDGKHSKDLLPWTKMFYHGEHPKAPAPRGMNVPGTVRLMTFDHTQRVYIVPENLCELMETYFFVNSEGKTCQGIVGKD